jgi:hypothetical protein
LPILGNNLLCIWLNFLPAFYVYFYSPSRWIY